MAGKVFHVDDDTHRLVREFCRDRNLKVSDWLAIAVRFAIENHGQPMTPSGTHDVSAVVDSKPRKPSVNKLEAVLKKRMPTLADPLDEANEVYARPPFWTGRDKN